MKHPKILVTGATGKTGAAVVTQLREQDWPVRAVVHSRDGRSARLERLGAEVVVADLYDSQQMLAAMQGTARAYFCPPVQPFMIQAAAVFAVAAREAKLESVVGLSQWLASPSHPSLHTCQQWLVENLLSMVPGVASTVVNPGIFADPILRMIPAAANLGMFPNPFGDLRNAPPSNEDMARVIVGVLKDPDRHAGKRYRPTGPKLLSMPDIAETVGRVVGREIKLQELPAKMFLRAARAGGADQFNLTSFQHYIADAKSGVFAVNAPTTDVYDVSGQEPESFETTARRYAALPEAQRTPANRRRALRDFLKILVTPAFNLDRYDAQQEHPQLALPRLAAASEVWQREHQPGTGVAAAGAARQEPEAVRGAARLADGAELIPSGEKLHLEVP